MLVCQYPIEVPAFSWDDTFDTSPMLLHLGIPHKFSSDLDMYYGLSMVATLLHNYLDFFLFRLSEMMLVLRSTLAYNCIDNSVRLMLTFIPSFSELS